MNRAFSLVELSIVLVILGLLVGGVLSGQSLIHAAELRTVSRDYARYYAAEQTFRDKYFAIPGDFNNAQAFWGQSTACGGAAATGVCNGNGDGNVNVAAGASLPGEMFMFWRELAFAGLIEGNYTGLSGPTVLVTGADSVVGTNVPKAKIGTTGWAIYYQPNYADGATYSYDYQNVFVFGSNNPGSIPDALALKPEDAWNIDTKMDDGKPGTGRVMARDGGGFGGSGCTTSTSNTDYAGNYNLAISSLYCTLKFPKVF